MINSGLIGGICIPMMLIWGKFRGNSHYKTLNLRNDSQDDPKCYRDPLLFHSFPMMAPFNHY